MKSFFLPKGLSLPPQPPSFPPPSPPLSQSHHQSIICFHPLASGRIKVNNPQRGGAHQGGYRKAPPLLPHLHSMPQFPCGKMFSFPPSPGPSWVRHKANLRAMILGAESSITQSQDC